MTATSDGVAPVTAPVRLQSAARPASPELGRAARTSCPLSCHAGLVLSTLRPDPAVLLDRQNVDRVPDLVPLRLARMSASPLAFFQGAAVVMADDLAGTPTSGIMVQLYGDAHLGNFGVYTTPAGRPVFDVRDFDETHPGPWEWDVKRLLASLAVSGQQNGFTAAERRTVLLRSARAYREALAGFALMPDDLDVWFMEADVTKLRRHRQLGMPLHRHTDPTRRRLTEVTGGTRRFVPDPPDLVPVRRLPFQERNVDLGDSICHLLKDYRATIRGDGQLLLDHYRVVEVARDAGSAGATATRSWIVLLTGMDSDQTLFLQVREAHRSVVCPTTVGTGSNHGRRVVDGQRMVQAADDIFLGWHRADNGQGGARDYYVRELRDWLPQAGVDWMAPARMAAFGELCGWTVAHAHARSGDRYALAAYLGEGQEFEESFADFAEAYADQNLRDYQRIRDLSNRT